MKIKKNGLYMASSNPINQTAYSPTAYSELHCLSNYSFLRGASHPHELVIEAKKQGYQAIAITDECSFSGIVKAWTEAKNQSIKLIIGSEFLVTIKADSKKQQSIKLILLAKNRQGYQQISTLISLARRRSEKGSYLLEFDNLIDSDITQCVSIMKIENLESQPLNYFLDNLDGLGDLELPSMWLGISLLQDGNDKSILNLASQLSNRFNLPIVACGNVHMHTSQRKPLQDLLTSIRIKKTIQNSGRNLFKNAENHLRSLSLLKNIYPLELIEQTQVIANCCNFDLSEIRYNYPKELVPKKESPSGYLKRLSYQGAKVRWPKGIPEHVNALLNKELKIINH